MLSMLFHILVDAKYLGSKLAGLSSRALNKIQQREGILLTEKNSTTAVFKETKDRVVSCPKERGLL